MSIEAANNPYRSSEVDAYANVPRRPVGTVICAGLLFFIAFSGLGAECTGYLRARTNDAAELNLHDLILVGQFGTVGLSAALACIGILLRRPLGWWFVVTFCYVEIATFVILPAFRFGIRMTSFTLTNLAIPLLLWLHLHTSRVRGYFGDEPRKLWLTDLSILLITTIVAVALGSW